MLACLENYLYKRIRKIGDPYGNTPRDIIDEMLKKNMISNPKQAWWTLEEWSLKGYYTYGCSFDLGWIENKHRPPRQN